VNNWTEFLSDDHLIKEIYGQKSPDIHQVHVHDIMAKAFENDVYLRFDVRDFPTTVPKKWLVNSYNRVQLTLGLIGATSIQINMNECKSLFSLSIQRYGVDIVLEAKSEGSSIHVVAPLLILSKISGYLDSGDDGL